MRTRYVLVLALLAFLAIDLHAQPGPAAADNAEVTAYERPFGTADLSFDPALRPFYHGVASGDPLPDRVILWTRITPEADGPVDVTWRMATDPDFQDVVQSGRVTTEAARDYTVKIDAAGLQPDRTYYYAFEALGETSLTGRTRTAPLGAADHLRFAIVSCSNYQNGFFNAYARIAERDDLSAVIHLGDYIYEYPEGGFGFDEEIGRGHEPDGEAVTLDDYRIRYSFYRLDPDLRRVHQQHPFITVWDDHEYANNAWKDGAENHQPETEGPWPARKSVANQAYFEWLPVREPEPAADGLKRVYRRIAYGDLLELYMLDTRIEEREEQAASDALPFTLVRAAESGQTIRRADLEALAKQPDVPRRDALNAALADAPQAGRLRVRDVITRAYGPEYARLAAATPPPDGPAVANEAAAPQANGDNGFRQLLGEAQYAWLTGGLADSGARWKLLGNQVQMMPVIGFPSTDAWDGYPEERARLLRFILDNDIEDVAVLTGDIHTTWSADVPQDLARYRPLSRRGSVLGEFVTPSVTASNIDEFLPGLEAETYDLVALLVRLLNPHVKNVDVTEHGYYVLDATPERLQADWFYVETVRERTAEERFARAFQMRRGERFIRRAQQPAAARTDAPAPAPEAPRAAAQGNSPVPSSGGGMLAFLSTYPNPFAERATLHYALREEQPVTITLYDVLGRRVRTVLDREQLAGVYRVSFDAEGLPSGTYLCRIQAGGAEATRSLVLAR